MVYKYLLNKSTQQNKCSINVRHYCYYKTIISNTAANTTTVAKRLKSTSPSQRGLYLLHQPCYSNVRLPATDTSVIHMVISSAFTLWLMCVLTHLCKSHLSSNLTQNPSCLVSGSPHYSLFRFPPCTVHVGLSHKPQDTSYRTIFTSVM